jgi:hypothetical protein
LRRALYGFDSVSESLERWINKAVRVNGNWFSEPERLKYVPEIPRCPRNTRKLDAVKLLDLQTPEQLSDCVFIALDDREVSIKLPR